MAKLTIDNIDFKDKKIFIRCDFNVPVDENGNITDDSRIRKSIPTIKKVHAEGGKIIVASHMGRPKGVVNEKLKMDRVGKRLEELLGLKVLKLNDSIGEEVDKAKREQKDEILLLENLRFHIGEEKNHQDFAKELGKDIDIFVNDAFGTAHRSHASNGGITEFVPVAAAGLLLEKEIKYLDETLKNPEHPFIAIIGGAKVSSKISVLKEFLKKVDAIIVGGAMAYTFLKARGIDIGDSKVEQEFIKTAKEVLKEAIDRDVQFLLPIDHVVADKFDKDANTKIVPRNCFDEPWMGMDIGPNTIEKFRREILKAKTIIWNGPMGVFEMEKFATGTNSIAQALAESNAVTIIGGGDSVAAINKSGLQDKMTHISTGGGASLEYMEKGELPAIKLLSEK